MAAVRRARCAPRPAGRGRAKRGGCAKHPRPNAVGGRPPLAGRRHELGELTACCWIGIFMSSILISRTSSGIAPGDRRIVLDPEVVHALQRLVVLLAEGHLALGRVEAHAFHRGDQLLGVGATSPSSSAVDHRHRGREAAGGEEVRRRVEALLVLGDQPVVHRVLRDVVVVVGRAFHAGELLVGRHRRQDVAAGRDLDAEALRVHVLRAWSADAGAGPDDPDDLAARLVLQRVEQALRRRGEVGGGRPARIPRATMRRAGLGQRVLERRDAVAAEGVVLRQRGDGDARLADRDRVARSRPARSCGRCGRCSGSTCRR